MKIRKGNGMKVINFEKAKARRYLKEKGAKQLPEIDDGILELQRQYQKAARFYNQWYDEHVVGQDENGRRIYKNL